MMGAVIPPLPPVWRDDEDPDDIDVDDRTGDFAEVDGVGLGRILLTMLSLVFVGVLGVVLVHFGGFERCVVAFGAGVDQVLNSNGTGQPIRCARCGKSPYIRDITEGVRGDVPHLIYRCDGCNHREWRRK